MPLFKTNGSSNSQKSVIICKDEDDYKKILTEKSMQNIEESDGFATVSHSKNVQSIMNSNTSIPLGEKLNYPQVLAPFQIKMPVITKKSNHGNPQFLGHSLKLAFNEETNISTDTPSNSFMSALKPVYSPKQSRKFDIKDFETQI